LPHPERPLSPNLPELKAITLKRQLDDAEKANILKRHGRTCFATGHGIPESEKVHFDHIQAFADGGPSTLDNIAPMCERHNKQKGRLPLEDFRIRLRLETFFEGGDTQTLHHLLDFLRREGSLDEFGQAASITSADGMVTIESAYGEPITTPLYTCPTTGWPYFYATLPVALLDSDDDRDDQRGLQPRYLIFGKVFELYRHFQRHPVLQPSVGRVLGDRIVLFDGQHKIAALLWTKRRAFECKVYLDPDLRLLNETNISAHDKFSQTRFFSSVMVRKLGAEFGREFEEYKGVEDGQPKTEAGFLAYLSTRGGHTRAEVNKRLRSYLYDAILQDPDNRMARFVSAGNRSSDAKPLTMDMLSKSIFSNFLYRNAVDENLATDTYRRDDEIANTVALLNMLHDLALHAWNPSAGAQDSTQRRLQRLFRSKSIMSWSEILRDAVLPTLNLYDSEDRARPFYRALTDEHREHLRQVVGRLVSWTRWDAPPGDEIDRILSDNKSAIKDWFKAKGLTTGYLMGAPE